MDIRVNLKLRPCLLLISILLATAYTWAGDNDDNNDVDNDIIELLEEEKERAEEEAEERAERLLESLIEQRLGDSDLDDDFEDEMESLLEEQLEANTSDDDFEDRMEEELEKRLESLADDNDQNEEQLEFVDDKLQQLWQFEEDIEDFLLPPLPNQMIALISIEELVAAKAQGAVVLQEESLTELGSVLVTFDSSQPIPINSEPNHLYQLDSLGNKTPDNKEAKNALSQASMMGVEKPLIAKQKVGLMDSSIDLQHACFDDLTINQHNFHDAAQPSFQHGTAMASILLGENNCNAQGLLNQAQLFNAVVFAQSDSGAVVASAAQLVAGLNWLLTQQVNIINMSLSGPPNRIIEKALQHVAARGITIVASAGNDGRAAFPRYPAAYPEVIAVTAIDQQLNAFNRAAQGDHIEVAAPGVNILIAQKKSYATLSGTSLAAAMVTAVLASEQPSLKRLDLSQRTEDLGSKGRDITYGFGLLKNNHLFRE